MEFFTRNFRLKHNCIKYPIESEKLHLFINIDYRHCQHTYKSHIEFKTRDDYFY